MKIAGLDIGTTGSKIVVLDSETGKKIDSFYVSYPSIHKGTIHEIDASSLKNAIFELITKLGKNHPDINCLGITSFGESFIPLDEFDNPLINIMLYVDNRGKEECEELVKKLGKEKIGKITGLSPSSMYSLPKIMYFKKHYPLLYKKTKRICLIGDFVGYLLTGNQFIDYSLATRTMAFDIEKLAFSKEILSSSGIDISLFSKPTKTGTKIGKIKPSLADKFHLNPSLEIIMVSHDQVACNVGSGTFENGEASDGSGTVECMIPVFKNIPQDSNFQENHYNIVPYFSSYIAYAFSYTGGSLVDWVINTLCKKEKEEAKEKNIEIHEFLKPNYQEPSGLLVLPHFAGAATPYMDKDSKGVIVGLTLTTNVKDIYKGTLEGLAFEMRINKELLAKSNVNINRLIATGGGSKNELYNQIKADILNIPIDVLEVEEAGTVGCAIIVGLEMGIYKSLKEASNKLIKIKKTYYPNKDTVSLYDKIYKRYKELYNKIKPLM